MLSWLWKKPVVTEPSKQAQALQFTTTLYPQVSEDRKAYTFILDFRTLDRCNGVPFIFSRDVKLIVDVSDRRSITAIQQDNHRPVNRVFIDNGTVYDSKYAIHIPVHTKYGWCWKTVDDCCNKANTIKVLLKDVPHKVPRLSINYIQLTASDPALFNNLLGGVSFDTPTYAFRDMSRMETSKTCSYNLTIDFFPTPFDISTFCIFIPKSSKCTLTSLRYIVDLPKGQPIECSIEPISVLSELFADISYTKNYYVFAVQLPSSIWMHGSDTKLYIEVDTQHDDNCVPVVMLYGYR